MLDIGPWAGPLATSSLVFLSKNRDYSLLLSHLTQLRLCWKGLLKWECIMLNTIHVVFFIINIKEIFHLVVFLILIIIIIIMSLKHGLPGNHTLAVFTVEQTWRDSSFIWDLTHSGLLPDIQGTINKTVSPVSHLLDTDSGRYLYSWMFLWDFISSSCNLLKNHGFGKYSSS